MEVSISLENTARLLKMNKHEFHEEFCRIKDKARLLGGEEVYRLRMLLTDKSYMTVHNKPNANEEYKVKAVCCGDCDLVFPEYFIECSIDAYTNQLDIYSNNTGDSYRDIDVCIMKDGYLDINLNLKGNHNLYSTLYTGGTDVSISARGDKNKPCILDIQTLKTYMKGCKVVGEGVNINLCAYVHSGFTAHIIDYMAKYGVVLNGIEGYIGFISIEGNEITLTSVTRTKEDTYDVTHDHKFVVPEQMLRDSEMFKLIFKFKKPST